MLESSSMGDVSFYQLSRIRNPSLYTSSPLLYNAFDFASNLFKISFHNFSHIY